MNIKFEIRHYIGIFITILALVASFLLDFKEIVLHMLIAVFSAVILDIIINYAKHKRFLLSPSTIVTGLIVGSVLIYDVAFYITILASSAAILSKHLIIYKKRHIFNPAAFGLFSASLIFPAINWWGIGNTWLAIIFGLILLYKLGKFELTVSYILAHTLIALSIGYFTGSGLTSFLTTTNIFFISFMLIEPITSPFKKKSRIIYGILVAVLSEIFLFTNSIDHSILGLLTANLFSRLLDKKL